MTEHHALLLIGTHDTCLSCIPAAHVHGADAELLITEQLGIDEVRALAERAARRPVASDRRRFIISVIRMTLEAQNALLKLFEDPPASAQFYLIVPRESILIPTLRSRVHIFFSETHTDATQYARGRAFLQASYPKRLEEIAALAKAENAAEMRAVVAAVEMVVAVDAQSYPVASIREMERVARYAELRGASHKMLLEHLALSMP